MAIVTTKNKWVALKAYLNSVWLKDPTVYCNNCGNDYLEGEGVCCENPQLGKNIDHCRGAIKQNKEIQNSRLRETGGNRTKTMRYAVSIPPRLYHDAERYFQKNYKEKLFNNRAELREFMKEFKYFTIPSKI